jgi:putative salt-induced outer membrane protein YdiY
MRSETALTCQINDKFSLRLSLVDEYDSKPIDPDIKKNDLRLISSFVASF